MGITVRRTSHLAAMSLLCCVNLSGCRKSDAHGAEGGEAETPGLECPAITAADCATAQGEIAALEAERDRAVVADDAATVARVSLKINHATERLRLLADGEVRPEVFSDLDSKYSQLTALLERELATSPSTSPKLPGRIAGLVYHPLEIEAVSRVFRDYGDLYVKPTGKTASGAPAFEEVTLDMPWAGYWYPLAGTELFGDDQSPLAKLDRVMAGLGRPIAAADKEREYREFAAEDSWEGRCFAWATAAITSSEPRAAREVEGVQFSIQDQKALLVKVHELYPTKVYGIRYDGDVETDGTLQDIRPEAFHRLALAVLGGKRRPFIIDDDPGIEVWSKPVYRLRWSIQPDPDRADAYLVDALPFMIGHRTAETDEATNIRDRTAPAYRYRLFVDPGQMVDGAAKVIAGEWLGDSRKGHPDSIAVADPDGPIGSSNTEINQALDVVRRIVGLED